MTTVPTEYVVMRGQRRFESAFKWDVCKVFGPRSAKTRGAVTVSRHQTRKDAKRHADELNLANRREREGA